MKDLLKKYEDKQPEIVFNWKDPETEAEGWTVINSLRGGAAGGGTRMRKGLDMNEVLSLAKTMDVKFTRLNIYSQAKVIHVGFARNSLGYRTRTP